jgi:hypothetical protein
VSITVALLIPTSAEGRFILGVDRVENDEAAVSLELLSRIGPYVPDAQAVVYDMALRGKHIQVILTELGLIAVVGVHAKRRSDKEKSRKHDDYVPKTLDLDDITVEMPDGTKEIVHLASCDGWLSIKTIKENGEPHYEPLEYVRIQPRRDKKRFRFYVQVRLPEEYGRKEVSIRLFQNAEDDRRGINRPENLRGIPEGSEDFKRLIKLRPDAEGINDGLKDSFFGRRAPAKGWRRVMVDLLGHARMNAVTLARCRARAPVSAAA